MRRALLVAWVAIWMLAPVAEAGGGVAKGKPMDNRTLGRMLAQKLKGLEGEPGAWRGTWRGSPVMVLTDEGHNRMRIISPVKDFESDDQVRLMRCMEANFSTALDARYCVYRGAIWSAFLHPLGELTESELDSALSQVVTLASTYGTTYSSGELRFGR